MLAAFAFFLQEDVLASNQMYPTNSLQCLVFSRYESEGCPRPSGRVLELYFILFHPADWNACGALER
jgi:hypothetical protein